MTGTDIGQYTITVLNLFLNSVSRHNGLGMGIKFAFKVKSASKIAYIIQGENIVCLPLR